MATFVLAHEFKNYVGAKKIDLSTGGGDTFKIGLTDSTPTAAGTQVLADLTMITTNGGAAKTVTHAWAETGAGTGIWRFSIGADQTWTAVTGAIPQFSYAVLYDDTPSGTPTKPIVGWWATGTQNIAENSTFTLNVDADFAVFELN